MGLLQILLTVLFVALKLMGYIAWGWVWVLSPIWITFALYLVSLAFFAGIAALGYRSSVKKFRRY